MTGLIIILLFIISLLLGIPIAYALGISALGTTVIMDIVPVNMLVQTLFTSGDSFPLLAVPFFILAGDIMMEGGISKRLVNFSSTMLSGKNGALGMITVVTCLIFASISGSGPATVAAIGGIMIPAMIKDNYDEDFACALTAASGSLGPIIPPSISFVMYGVIAQVSITDLFIAGIVPGIMMGIALLIFVYIVAKKRNYGEVKVKSNAKDKWKSLNEAKWSLMVPVIILGGIYGGIFTPTEAAIVACDYAIIIGVFVYKEIKFKDLYRIFSRTALTSGTVLVLVGTATFLGKIMAIEMIPAAIANGILGITSNKIIILLLVNLLLFITGMFIETLAAIIILTPLLLAIVQPLGISPLHFGIIMVVNLVIGMCTPPVGVNLFVASSIAGVKIEKMFKWIVPLIGVLLIVLLVLTFVPQLSTFLPSILTK